MSCYSLWLSTWHPCGFPCHGSSVPFTKVMAAVLLTPAEALALSICIHLATQALCQGCSLSADYSGCGYHCPLHQAVVISHPLSGCTEAGPAAANDSYQEAAAPLCYILGDSRKLHADWDQSGSPLFHYPPRLQFLNRSHQRKFTVSWKRRLSLGLFYSSC